MSANLAEFIKVFLVVFTFSGGILAFRKYMLDMDEEDIDDDKSPSEEKAVISSMKKRHHEPFPSNNLSPDFIDYDGMGNQGRFINSAPKTKNRRTK
tara:strand:+ start:2224 stop:2511 length:288 start_codon:yes stop_codon:yes gene_type:complete